MKLSRKWLNEFVDLASVNDREFAEGMTTIPEYALYNCNTIKSVTIPSTLSCFSFGITLEI